MLQIFSQKKRNFETVRLEKEVLCDDAIWYDLAFPESHEIAAVEKALKIHVPSLDEMREIEESSRLYEEKEVLYMTSIVIAKAEELPIATPVSFILTPNALVTVRHSETKPFQAFSKKILKNGYQQSDMLFLGLLESIVERLADILELNANAIEKISKEIFKTNHSNNQREMHDILANIGKIGDLNSKIRESLETFDRQLIFFYDQFQGTHKKTKDKCLSLQQDIKSLVDYSTFLFGRTNLLLNATLGFIEIQQNNTIKIFSIAAVIFLPPTLIASIYGMNFVQIPELEWYFGYPFALLLMAVSILVPLIFFKRKRWF
jgi:magnesium transporter